MLWEWSASLVLIVLTAFSPLSHCCEISERHSDLQKQLIPCFRPLWSYQQSCICGGWGVQPPSWSSRPPLVIPTKLFRGLTETPLDPLHCWLLWTCDIHLKNLCKNHHFTLPWCNFQVPKCTKIQNFLGLRSWPHWGSLQCSPRPPSWWGGG